MVETISFGNLNWHHILNPTQKDLDFLLDEFHFHPLDIEDCMSTNQRPKIDVYDDYNFLILHFPYFEKTNNLLRTKEVKVFWGKDYIITIGRSHWVVKNLFNATKNHPETADEFMKKNSDALLYTILYRLMVESYSLLLRIGAEVELINRELFSKKAEQTIERISVTRRNIILLNTIFKPQLRLFHKFESGDIKGFSGLEEMEDYWGNILDYYQKIWDMIEDNGELIDGLSTTFDSLQTNRINEIMKVMTFISTFFLPLTFLTGLYGMNVVLPLAENTNAFIILIAVMSLFAFIFIMYFKRKKWM